MLDEKLMEELRGLARKYRPRGDVILFKIVSGIKSQGGVIMPDIASEGKANFVVAVGEEVKDLKLGDRVIFIATQGSLGEVTGQRGLYFTRQSNCMLEVKE